MNNGNMSMLDQAIQALLELARQADADVKEKVEMLASARAAQRRVKAMLRAAGVVEAAPPQPKKGKKPVPVSEEMQARLLDVIHEHIKTREAAVADVPGSFTAPGLIAIADMHQSSVNAALNTLREKGIVRAIGRATRKPGSGAGFAAMAYTLDEEHGK